MRASYSACMRSQVYTLSSKRNLFQYRPKDSYLKRESTLTATSTPLTQVLGRGGVGYIVAERIEVALSTAFSYRTYFG